MEEGRKRAKESHRRIGRGQHKLSLAGSKASDVPSQRSDPPSWVPASLPSLRKNLHGYTHMHPSSASPDGVRPCCTRAQDRRMLQFICRPQMEVGGHTDFPPRRLRPSPDCGVGHHEFDSVKDEGGNRSSSSVRPPFPVHPLLTATSMTIKPPVPLEGPSAADVDHDGWKDIFSG